MPFIVKSLGHLLLSHVMTLGQWIGGVRVGSTIHLRFIDYTPTQIHVRPLDRIQVSSLWCHCLYMLVMLLLLLLLLVTIHRCPQGGIPTVPPHVSTYRIIIIYRTPCHATGQRISIHVATNVIIIIKHLLVGWHLLCTVDARGVGGIVRGGLKG